MRQHRSISTSFDRSRKVIAIWLALLVAFSTVFTENPASAHHSDDAFSISVGFSDAAGDTGGTGHHGSMSCHVGFGCTASVLPGSEGVVQGPSLLLRRLIPSVQMWRTRNHSPAFKPPIA
tara:strand:+ start:400 stop:759 length:360 start_codon:yes stop_codon:yes gene_type:complete